MAGRSGLGGLIFLAVVGGAIVLWPSYVDRTGTAASGVISEKHETVRVEGGDWFRHFEILAAYSVPGQPVQRHASCGVDETTYDSLRQGSPVTVHYLPSLLMQPFVPATHMSPCSLVAISGVSPAIRRLGIALLALLPILFLWRIVRMRGVAWLFLAWGALTFIYVIIPRTEPAPRQPVAGVATVQQITTVRDLIRGMRTQDELPLLHPYQVVQLSFLPPGKDAPVIAVDRIDENSIAGLAQGRTVPIVYDASDPRIAQLQGGARRFPGQARTTVLILGGLFAALITIGYGIRAFLRRAMPGARYRP